MQEQNEIKKDMEIHIKMSESEIILKLEGSSTAVMAGILTAMTESEDFYHALKDALALWENDEVQKMKNEFTNRK